MKLNAKTKAALAKAKAAYLAKTAKAVKTVKAIKTKVVTSNFWSKLKELGSYRYGVKFYNLRKSDYSAQALTDWAKAKGASKRLILLSWGTKGILHNSVECKGTVVRVSDSQGFDTDQIKCEHKLLALNSAVALIRAKGTREKKFNYDSRTFSGWLLQKSSAHYGVFTDGRNLFECEARRIAGKGEAQKRHLWSVG